MIKKSLDPIKKKEKKYDFKKNPFMDYHASCGATCNGIADVCSGRSFH